jgi:hypothetical protein
MNRLGAFLVACAFAVTACGYTGRGEKQWYKPNADYTTAEFERDRAECTDKATKVLAEDCMQKLGWAALNPDIGPAVKAPEPSKQNPKSKY